MTTFSARNSKGESTFDLVLAGVKTITRRRSPQKVGSTRAIQPGRGKKSQGRYLVVSCLPHLIWFRGVLEASKLEMETNPTWLKDTLDQEGIDEGMSGWSELIEVEKEIYGDDWESKLYRIEMKLVK